MKEELRGGQIVPVAQALDTFVRPETIQAAGAAQPSALPRAEGIRLLQSGNGGNVQGSNRFAELAAALAPFNQRLTELAGQGIEMYASGEYQKGRNLAVRAQVLANQQRESTSLVYAKETRDLARQDPAAGQMMAQLNPFQKAGYINQLSRTAATEAQALQLQEYRSIPNAQTLDPEDPQLAAAKVRATQKLLDKYGLEEGTPGFLDYVLPEINQGWAKVAEVHMKDRTSYLADMLPRHTAALMAGRYAQARTTGTVEWTEFDPATGAPTKLSASLQQDPEGWKRGLTMLFQQDLDEMVAKSMQPGEAAKLRERAGEIIAGLAGQGNDSELLDVFRRTGGNPNEKGQRAAMGLAYGPDLLNAYDQTSQITYRTQQRVEESAMKAAGAELFAVTAGMEDGPERFAAIQAWLGKHTQAGLDPLALGELAERASKATDNLAARAFDPSEMEAFLGELETTDVSAWNPQEAREFYDRMRQTLAPEDRAAADQRFATIFRRFESQKDEAPLALTDPLISGKIKANLKAMYPGTATEAALRGANITDMLAFGDANVARSAALQQQAYRQHVYNRLAEARKKKGSALDPAEITRVTSEALAEYGKSDKEALNQLFPGSAKSGVPSVSGAMPQAPGAGGAGPAAPAAGAKPAAPAGPVVSSSNLDNLPNRGARLKDGGAVLNYESTSQEVMRVLNGGRASNGVQRAAKDAGLTVGQFLVRQAEAYPAMKLPPAARQQLLKQSRDAQATSSSIQPNPASGLLASAGNWLMNIVAPPAMARTMPIPTISLRRPQTASRTYGGGGGGGAYVGTQANGYSADRRTQTLTGIKGHPSYDKNHGVGNDHVHHGAFDKADAMALARFLKARGLPITEFKPWGNVAGVHKDPGHYDGRSFDIPVATGRHREVLKAIDEFYAQRRGGTNQAALARGFGKVGDRHKRIGQDLIGDVTYYTGSGGSDGKLGGNTANGEIFTGKKMTAAVQWGLKDRYINKWVVVESLDTGRMVRVWVNDTGQMGGSEAAPRDRVLDLSPTAYRKLKGSLGGGVGRIRMRIDPNQSGRP